MFAWTDTIDHFFVDHLGFPEGLFIKILISLLLYVGARFLLWFLQDLTRRHVAELPRRHIVNKIITYSIWFLLVIILLTYWIGTGSGILAYFGLLSAGLAVAMQDPLATLAGWLYILVSKPFSLGDRIQIDGHAGDVVDIRMAATTILEIGNWVDADQSTGRVIHIPNGWFLKRSLANFNQRFNFIWHEIPVTITFESNWQAALEIVQKILEHHNPMDEVDAQKQVEEASTHFTIQYQKLTPVVWLSVADSGVTLTLRYLCEPKRRRSTADLIWKEILIAFAARGDIDFAYPTRRAYLNHLEGKPGAGGPSAPAGGPAPPADSPNSHEKGAPS